MADSALQTLSTQLCPWLAPSLEQLDSARLSSRLGHGWLLKGPAGIGKVNLACVLAARLLAGGSLPPPAPLAAADAVAAMQARREPSDHHPDLHRIFPEGDKRTIGIDQIRAIGEALTLKGYHGGAKVAIIEPAEAMTTAAANALLKTLEEPAEGGYLLLVAHQPDRLPATVRSRCQSLIVPAPEPAEAAAWLGVPPDHPALLLHGRAPLLAAALLGDEKKTQFIMGLQEQVEGVSSGRRDPRSVAESWVKGDIELALQWLISRLQAAARAAAGVRDQKAVTVARNDSLHNAWCRMPPRTLLERSSAAEKLLDRLGSGLNVEMALHALLLGLRTEQRK